MPSKKISVLLGENIAARRKKLNMTQARLAEALEIGQDALSRMEKGQIAPKMERLQDIAGLLQCSVPDLFRDDTDTHQTRAATVADMLQSLPEEGQDALVQLAATMVRIIKHGK